MANRKKSLQTKTDDRRKKKSYSETTPGIRYQSAEDIQEALKDLLSGTPQDMLETEMDNHLGTIVMKDLMSLITVMEQSLKLFVVNTVNSK